MAEDSWYRVALPVLEYLHSHGGSTAVLSVADVAKAIDLGAEDVGSELDRLLLAGVVKGELRRGLGSTAGNGHLLHPVLGESGLRAVGAWPSDDPYEALVALLERQIAATDDPEKKSKLHKLVTTFSDVGKATVTGLLVEFLKGNIHF